MITNEDIARCLFYNGQFDFYVCYWYKPGRLREDLTLEDANLLAQGSSFRQVSEQRLEEELLSVEEKVRRYRNFRTLLEEDIQSLFGIYAPRECINRAILELENGRDKKLVTADILREIVYDYPSKPEWIETIEQVPQIVSTYKLSVKQAMSKRVLVPHHERQLNSYLEDIDLIVRLTPHHGLPWFFERFDMIRRSISEIFFYLIKQNLDKFDLRMMICLSTYYKPKGELYGEYREHYKLAFPEICVDASIKYPDEIKDLRSYVATHTRKDKCACGRNDLVKFTFQAPIAPYEFCRYGMTPAMEDWKVNYWLYMHYTTKNKFVEFVINKRERHTVWCTVTLPPNLLPRIPYAASDFYSTILGNRAKGNHAQIDPQLYKMLEQMGYDREAFASPFNNTLSHWYSVCPLDRFLGSRGSYFLEENPGNYLVNPPYEYYIIDKLLKNLNESSKYIIFLPYKDLMIEICKELSLEYIVVPKSKIKMRTFWEKDRNFGDGKIFEPVVDIMVVFKGQDSDEQNSFYG